MSTQYIVASRVRLLAHRHQRIVTKAFLTQLDRIVEQMVTMSCRTHDGGRKSLSEFVLANNYRNLNK